ncbi:MAG: glycosyltransferase family 4 protein [Candidatus Helarchaeota archaeon]|nr:glycosyltransferase family 4 protein [Candidatus Helarchaeota archaeon]
MRICWLSTEMGEYTSGIANHNRILVEYLKNHPEVEDITVVRYPLPENGFFIQNPQQWRGVNIFSPKVALNIKGALNSFKKADLNLKAKIQFWFLRLGIKLKKMSFFNLSKIKKAGKISLAAFAILSFQKPFPNPFWKEFTNCILKTKPDIVQSQAALLIIGGVLARDKIKAHLSSQMTLPGAIEGEKGSINYEFEKRFNEALKWGIEADKTDFFLPVSQDVKNYLVSLGADPNKIKIMQTPIVIKDFNRVDKLVAREKLGLPKNKKIILSVGRMTMQKRFQDILEILKMMPKDVVFFLKKSRCISEEFFESAHLLFSLIKKYKLKDRVIINDSVLPYNEMKYVYQSCDVAVFPYIGEPQGTCVTECIANGRPIVVYNSGYLPNYINGNGYLVEPKNIKSLYEKTKIFLDDERVAKEAGEKSIELALKYDINIIGEQLINLYKEFL